MPKIFYATRTHSQIAQVPHFPKFLQNKNENDAQHTIFRCRSRVNSNERLTNREWQFWHVSSAGSLQREAQRYCKVVKLTCLLQGSREQYCINPAVVKKPNKDEECDKLLSDNGCTYFKNKMPNTAVPQVGSSPFRQSHTRQVVLDARLCVLWLTKPLC